MNALLFGFLLTSITRLFERTSSLIVSLAGDHYYYCRFRGWYYAWSSSTTSCPNVSGPYFHKHKFDAIGLLARDTAPYSAFDPVSVCSVHQWVKRLDDNMGSWSVARAILWCIRGDLWGDIDCETMILIPTMMLWHAFIKCTVLTKMDTCYVWTPRNNRVHTKCRHANGTF